jgi:hypothetical protein
MEIDLKRNAQLGNLKDTFRQRSYRMNPSLSQVAPLLDRTLSGVDPVGQTLEPNILMASWIAVILQALL